MSIEDLKIDLRTLAMVVGALGVGGGGYFGGVTQESIGHAAEEKEFVISEKELIEALQRCQQVKDSLVKAMIDAQNSNEKAREVPKI